MHLHRSLFSTCNLQLYWTRDAGIHIFPKILRIFLGTTLLLKTSCELVLKGEFYEKWQNDILHINRYRKVDISCIDQRLWGESIFENHGSNVDSELKSNFQLLLRYFFSEGFYWCICLSLTVFRKKYRECFKVQL